MSIQSQVCVAILAMTLKLLAACEPHDRYKYARSTLVDDGVFDMDLDMVGATCVPLSQCPTGVCGLIPDGCGGSLSCDECVCQGDGPQREGCGLCGLGLLSCQAGVATCEDIPIPEGARVSCSEIVHVVANIAPGGDGSREAPLGSIQEALRVAKSSGAKVILLGGDGTFNESIELVNGVSVLGGFHPVNFKRDLSYRPVIEPENTMDDLIAVRGYLLNRPAVLSYFRIRTPDALGGSAQNVGIWLDNVQEIRLHQLDIRVGRGGPGDPGQNGESGVDGSHGKERDCTYQFDQYGDEIYPKEYEPAGAGENSSCPEADGGVGGRGGLRGSYMSRAAEDGSKSASGASGGKAGTNFATDINALNGQDGAFGMTPQERGKAGQQGRTQLRFDTSTRSWDISSGDGGVGERGLHGQGGGGGGGAGVELWQNDPRYWMDGPVGGGGGAGGCGGMPGTGGFPGGMSVGLVVVESAVHGIGVTIYASLGGQGGIAGQGGDGGRGAEGGRGVALTCRGQNPYPSTLYARSGAGGQGSHGAPGGHGGGGAGGPSLGALCHRASLVLDSSSSLMSQGRAPGGDSLGIPGEDGLSAQEQGCR